MSAVCSTVMYIEYECSSLPVFALHFRTEYCTLDLWLLIIVRRNGFFLGFLAT